MCSRVFCRVFINNHESEWGVCGCGLTLPSDFLFLNRFVFPRRVLPDYHVYSSSGAVLFAELQGTSLSIFSKTSLVELSKATLKCFLCTVTWTPHYGMKSLEREWYRRNQHPFNSFYYSNFKLLRVLPPLNLF
jgi:hypothetical protein